MTTTDKEDAVETTLETPLATLNALLAKRRQGTPSAEVILNDLRQAGVELFPTDDGVNLQVKSGSLNDEQRKLVKDHKAALLDHLTGISMKFDFWVPTEVDEIIKVLLVRISHHDWPGSQVTRRQYGNLQDEFDAAHASGNGERLRRAESKLHAFLDEEPFCIDHVESKEGHGGRIWYEPRNAGLAGFVKPASFRSWRNVCRGVPHGDRDYLREYLKEYKAAIGPTCQGKIEDMGTLFEL